MTEKFFPLFAAVDGDNRDPAWTMSHCSPFGGPSLLDSRTTKTGPEAQSTIMNQMIYIRALHSVLIPNNITDSHPDQSLLHLYQIEGSLDDTLVAR